MSTNDFSKEDLLRDQLDDCYAVKEYFRRENKRYEMIIVVMSIAFSLLILYSIFAVWSTGCK